MSVRLTTLGPPRCLVDDSPTNLPAQKLRFALLVYLAVEKSVTRESVAAMFWPDRDPERARHALSQAIYELRRLLGEDWLDAQPDPLEVTDAIEVDALEFERRIAEGDVDKALALYTGEYLAGFHLKGANEFESWAEGKRLELKRLHHRACQTHIAALIAQNRASQALVLAQRWAQLERLDDEANHAYIDTLARSGQRAEAIAHFDAYEKRIHAELGVAPLDETRALIARIRHAAPSTPSMLTRPVTLWWRLKQSRIAKTAAVYTASTFVVIQFLDVMVPALRLPDIIITLTAAIALLGFPIAMIIAWASGRGEPDGNPVYDGPPSREVTQEFLNAEHARGKKLRNRAVVFTAFATVVSVVLLYSAVKNRDMVLVNGMPLDTTLYVVLPFTSSGGSDTLVNADLLVRDALSGWDGISIVESFQVREALSRAGPSMDTRSAAKLTREFGAARFILGDITRVGDSLRIYAVIYDASRKRPAAGASTVIKVPNSLANVEGRIASLAEGLLLPSHTKASGYELSGGTASLVARRAFTGGLEAMRDWDLARADTQFAQAVRSDAGYTRARLWLGLVRAWAQADPALWTGVAETVVADSMRLGERERTLAGALWSLSRQELPRACAAFRSLANAQAHDFLAWYGLADCLSRDAVVVVDSASASGWSFRSSYHEATGAYRRAYQLLPSMHRALAAGSYERVRRTLKTSPTALRSGFSLPPDAQRFEAYPAMAAETLQFVPFPVAELASARATVPQAARRRAVQQQRSTFHSIATSWVNSFPASAEALQAVALSLELLNDRTALDTLMKARSLAAAPELRHRLALQEWSLRIKLGLPNDVRLLKRAAQLGDSLLEDTAMYDVEPRSLAAVAVLGGRLGLAVQLLGNGPVQRLDGLPAPLRDVASPLEIYAAVGVHPDSLRILEAKLRGGLAQMSSPERESAFISSYVRPAILAFSITPFADLDGVAKFTMVGRAQHGYAQGRPNDAIRELNRIAASRKDIRPEEIGIDALLAEAALLSQLRNDRAALAWIRPTLDALSLTSPGLLLDPVVAGATLRGGLFAAELSHAQGDRARARIWGAAITTLLKNGDPAVRGYLERAERIMVR